MISPQLRALARCPICTAETAGHAPPLADAAPDRLPARAAGGNMRLRRRRYLDLMPRAAGDLGHTSRYVADLAEFAERLDYREMAPPLLGAAVRNRLLRQMLALNPRDRVLELGCGNGKFLLWNRDLVGQSVGIDPAPLFADEALARLDLVQGDARLLPFPNNSFSKAWSIDVLEHLDHADIARYLARSVPRAGAGWADVHLLEHPRARPVRLPGRRLARPGELAGPPRPGRPAPRPAAQVGPLKVLETWDHVEAAVTERPLRDPPCRLLERRSFQSFIDNVRAALGRARRGTTSPSAPPRTGAGDVPPPSQHGKDAGAVRPAPAFDPAGKARWPRGAPCAGD